MDDKLIEAVSFDCHSGHEFVLYFSDDTYAAISAAGLASRFPDRQPLSRMEDYTN